jgi:hypothetical protein
MRRSWRRGSALLTVASAGAAVIALALDSPSATEPIAASAASQAQVNKAQVNQPSQPTPAGPLARYPAAPRPANGGWLRRRASPTTPAWR